MYIDDIIWLDDIIDKIEHKHRVLPEEVEEVFYNIPKYRKAQKGKYEGEDLYYAYGRTDSGRYLLVVFIYKENREALIISARDMDKQERKRYGKK
ncbi:MAG: BrnT family toxin [Calditrichaeota bacterium]|nr:BrnT family toxin [Calditrichota bacterium]MCB0289653.1 BrnT family toxin [Calditrichota bacterium]MCB0294606.1 BrnT family toxin [Calditrichota bacterium]MCB0311648.1 BrnT family toxin [Calditrichota bacterium]MCB9087648.1 BrnT family toxin [Calditrichia bacterium]